MPLNRTAHATPPGQSQSQPSTQKATTGQLNLHYLELFYYVAKARGISRAHTVMPYTVQQPSLSRQLKELEAQAGTVLFERRPFRLSPAGEKLFAVVDHFFKELDALRELLRAGVPELVRIAASPIVLRDYLPPHLHELEKSFPGMRFTLKEGLQSQILLWFESRQIDLAVTMLDGAPPRGCDCERLLSLPMILVVPEKSPHRCLEDLLQKRGRADQLIGPQPDDAVSRCFQQGLGRRSVTWPIEDFVNSIELVESCVAKGFGVGVSVSVPGRRPPPGLRELPLPGFPLIEMGMIWRHNPNRITEALMKSLRIRARQIRREVRAQAKTRRGAGARTKAARRKAGARALTK